MRNIEDDICRRIENDPVWKWVREQALKRPSPFPKSHAQANWKLGVKLGLKMGPPPSHPASWNPFYHT